MPGRNTCNAFRPGGKSTATRWFGLVAALLAIARNVANGQQKAQEYQPNVEADVEGASILAEVKTTYQNQPDANNPYHAHLQLSRLDSQRVLCHYGVQIANLIYLAFDER